MSYKLISLVELTGFTLHPLYPISLTVQRRSVLRWGVCMSHARLHLLLLALPFLKKKKKKKKIGKHMPRSCTVMGHVPFEIV